MSTAAGAELQADANALQIAMSARRLGIIVAGVCTKRAALFRPDYTQKVVRSVYSTCLFCHSPLGANEAIENFPVGRRLAFDAAKGRLWAVCRKCERWNLTPIEERWEAVEECERSYRDTKLRVSTGEIGLGRLREGTELVRIGKPLRPEFAAWRYGDQFGRRRRKNIVRVGIGVAAGLSIPLVGPLIGVSLGGIGWYGWQFGSLAWDVVERVRPLARVRDHEGGILHIRIHDAIEAEMLTAGAGFPWGLRLTHRARPEEAVWWKLSQNDSVTDVRGEVAMRAAAKILPYLNRSGAKAKVVEDAVRMATEDESPMKSFEKAAKFARRQAIAADKGEMLASLPVEMRLALEMASHDDAERRAMEGELRQLEEAWRDAEEIAMISDNMFLPADVSERLEQIKRNTHAQQ